MIAADCRTARPKQASTHIRLGAGEDWWRVGCGAWGAKPLERTHEPCTYETSKGHAAACRRWQAKGPPHRLLVAAHGRRWTQRHVPTLAAAGAGCGRCGVLSAELCYEHALRVPREDGACTRACMHRSAWIGWACMHRSAWIGWAGKALDVQQPGRCATRGALANRSRKRRAEPAWVVRT